MTSTPIRTHESLRSDEAISAYGRARSTVEGTPAQPRRAAQDRRVLACQPLSVPRNAVPQGQPVAARAAYLGAHKAAAARPLGLGRRPSLYLHSLQPADQQIRPQRDLHLWPRARGARRSVSGVPRGDVLRNLSGKERRPRRDAALLQAVLVSRRHRQPRHPGNARQYPRGRRARLQHLARLRHGLRPPGPDHSSDGGRRRVRDRSAGDQLAQQQIPQPDHRRRGAAGPASQRLQDQQPDHSGPHQPRRAEGAVRRLWVHAVFRRRQRSRKHAPGDGRHPGALRPGDPRDPGKGAAHRQGLSAALA